MRANLERTEMRLDRLKQQRETMGAVNLRADLETKEIDEVVDPELQLAANALRVGKWWGPDKLFERYGGEEFQKFKGQERIELLLEKGKEILL